MIHLFPPALSGVARRAAKQLAQRMAQRALSAGMAQAASGLRAYAAQRAKAEPSKPYVPPPGGQFLAATHTDRAGSLDYKLYLPPGLRPGAPLLVMLHGCTQAPDDFARGTRMNERAGARGWAVLYPAQRAAANPNRCWNWFRPEDRAREAGEACRIAGAVRAVLAQCRLDPARVYAAGLSAGGAQAAVLGARFPDLFAAIGVHSGLACGAAHDVPSALAAMRSGASGDAPRPGAGVPAIVFHGTADRTVNPVNADRVVAQVLGAAGGTGLPQASTTAGQDGHAWRRTTHRTADGRVIAEDWRIDGAGHAWSGGDPAGSYTDTRGPDASAEMLRFFGEHRRV